MKNPIYVENILSSIKSNDLSLISNYLDEKTVFSYSSNKLTSFLSFFCNCQGKEEILKSKNLEKDSIKQLNIRINSIHHVDRVALISVTISYEHIESKKTFSLSLFNEIILDSSLKIKEWNVHGDFYNLYEIFKYELEKQIIDSVSKNDFKLTEELLDHGAYVNTRDPNTGLTLLMMASCQGNSRIVELLINKGADVYTTDSFTGATALHKACQGQNVEVAKLLTKSGSFIDAVTPTMGHTPIMDALWYQSKDIVKHLVTCNPNLETKTHYGFTLWDHLEYETKVQGTEEGKNIMNNIKKDIEEYKLKCQSMIADQKIMAATEKGDIEEVSKLIKIGESVETVYPHVNTFSDGHTPLIVACRDNHPEIVQLLLNAGAKVNVFDWVFKGFTIHKATYNGRPDILKMLLDSERMTEEVVNVQGHINGYTPLVDALWHGFEECSLILLNDPRCKLGFKGHDGKNEYDVALQVFGKEHHITKKIKEKMDNIV
jgi:ankyrin repeat protein